MNIQGEYVNVFLKNGFRYFGEVLKDEESSIWIVDEKSGKKMMISRDSISTLEIQN